VIIGDFMNNRKDKLSIVLPAMKLDILSRHKDIMTVLSEIALNHKFHRQGQIIINSKIFNVIVNSVQSNMGLLLVTGEINREDTPSQFSLNAASLSSRVSWNEITKELYRFLNEEFLTKTGWLLTEHVISEIRFCDVFLDIALKTSNNMGNEFSVKGQCMVKSEKGFTVLTKRY
jgi:hypothetical protein